MLMWVSEFSPYLGRIVLTQFIRMKIIVTQVLISVMMIDLIIDEQVVTDPMMVN